MHPLLSRIRPSLRTAALAWSVVRGLAWLVAGWHGRVWPRLEAEAFEVGGGLWVAVARGIRSVRGGLPEVWGIDGSVLAVAAAGELAVLGSAVALYAAVRRRELPQTSSRAVWFWLACPVAVLTLPAGPWNFAAAAGLGACAAVAAARPIAASLLLALAVGLRPELVILSPGLAWGVWTECSPEERAFGAWFVVAAPAAVFTVCVVGALGLLPGLDLPMHGLYPGEGWRGDLAAADLLSRPSLAIFAFAALAAGVSLSREFTELPGYWIALALPVLAWPFAHRPVGDAAGIWLVALPVFAALGRTVDDRGVERALLAASLGAQWLWIAV